jgi:ligand-binding sensor domain-containing protein
MTKYSFHSHIYTLLLVGLIINSCSGQVNTSSPKERTSASKPSPEVIGATPPSSLYRPPYNDTSLVGQYIRSIFQDSKGNLWFAPVGESVARYDEKTLKYYSKDDFFQGNNSGADNAISVHAITEDKNGNIWFGTERGAIKFDGKTFKSYTEKMD